MSSRQAPEAAAFESQVTNFLAELGSDPDAQAVVFNLDHGGADVIATLESLALRPHGLTKAGFTILMAVWITGPRETRELAAVLLVTKGAVVGVVQTLERAGLVTRERSTEDRRLVTVHLTEAGGDLIRRAQKDWHRLEEAVTADLTAAEKRSFAALCRTVAHRARIMRHEQCRGQIPYLPDPADFLQKAQNTEPDIRQKEAPHAATPR